MKNNNADFVKFCVGKVGVPYILGTNGKVLTKAALDDLVRRNPGGWFTSKRLPTVKAQVGHVATDCHGLVEWFIAELAGGKWGYDVTADGAFALAQTKGAIGSIPELAGVCVRYPGHVGVYIGGGYVVEARGFDYGVCITPLKGRPWTHWYRHPKIKYTKTVLPPPSPAKVGKTTNKYSVVWLQLALNRQIAAGDIRPAFPGMPAPVDGKQGLLAVDGIYGTRTAQAAAAYWRKKGWTTKEEIWGVGANTIKAIGKGA